MKSSRAKNQIVWLFVAFIAVMLSAPNATISKVAVATADPFYWNMARYLIVLLVLTPFVAGKIRQLFHKNVRVPLLVAGVSMAMAVSVYIFAIKYSQASYVSIVTLATPIITIMLSLLLLKEKITHRAIAGITVAAIGAMTLVVLPIAISQDNFTIYPLATVLTLLNGLFFSLAIIYMRKANEVHKISIWAIIWFSSLVVAGISTVLFVVFGDRSMMPNDANFFLAAIYAGVVVGCVARALSVLVFEKIGSATYGAFGYLENFTAILIPVVVLNERLSIPMVVGGVLILLGLYIIEHHKYQHPKRHMLHRHQ